MLRLREGDIWKAVLLVVAIVAVAAFGIYNVARFTRTTRPAPAGAGTVSRGTAAPAPSGAEMFAPRQAGMVELLAQARVAPDPFRPYLTLASHTAAEPGLPSQPKAPSRVRPLPALPGDEADRTTLELVGVVSGTSPLAVLGDGKKRYYVRTGDEVIDKWSVTGIGATSVTLSKGRAQVTLPLAAPPS